MTDIATALRELSEPVDRGEKIAVVIQRAARRAGLAYWRTFDLWYGKARTVSDEEVECVASALEKKRREAARNELSELRIRIERLESLLVQTDPDFHRPTIDLMRSQRRAGLRGDGLKDRSLDSGLTPPAGFRRSLA
ncbi:hypothetical protein [Pseudorhodoplanes sinuspersici]|uniref:Uncharacterized protein n=1 Tax=Pseudorhodoplanes sinuspersici TaxID=1235591 RepID=A0A1W6ZX69_9HYPH|nr:hypothetical protein [Pseudorhodoplanes sinuspersici]ARQ01910.1 hypothetical protein CAK95_24530 [Pseudorhodoplanes sinuspersici]RKE73679.1 hypothetical protein DFP91_1574 [Pseudorhodoplanes sinuspersici]